MNASSAIINVLSGDVMYLCACFSLKDVVVVAVEVVVVVPVLWFRVNEQVLFEEGDGTRIDCGTVSLFMLCFILH